MSRNILLALTTVMLSLAFPALRAQDAPTYKLPNTEPLVTLALPDGFKYGDVSVAVSKALLAETWENLGWEGPVTTASTKQSRVNIKVFALASATDVKFYTEYAAESKITPEKCRQIVLGKVRDLERAIADALKLDFRKAKGAGTVDQATAS